eukprot:g70814.t1
MTNSGSQLYFSDGSTTTCGIRWSDDNHGIFCQRTNNQMFVREYGDIHFQTTGATWRAQMNSNGFYVPSQGASTSVQIGMSRSGYPNEPMILLRSGNNANNRGFIATSPEQAWQNLDLWLEFAIENKNKAKKEEEEPEDPVNEEPTVEEPDDVKTEAKTEEKTDEKTDEDKDLVDSSSGEEDSEGDAGINTFSSKVSVSIVEDSSDQTTIFFNQLPACHPAIVNNPLITQLTHFPAAAANSAWGMFFLTNCCFEKYGTGAMEELKKPFLDNQHGAEETCDVEVVKFTRSTSAQETPEESGESSVSEEEKQQADKARRVHRKHLLKLGNKLRDLLCATANFMAALAWTAALAKEAGLSPAKAGLMGPIQGRHSNLLAVWLETLLLVGFFATGLYQLLGIKHKVRLAKRYQGMVLARREQVSLKKAKRKEAKGKTQTEGTEVPAVNSKEGQGEAAGAEIGTTEDVPIWQRIDTKAAKDTLAKAAQQAANEFETRAFSRSVDLIVDAGGFACAVSFSQALTASVDVNSMGGAWLYALVTLMLWPAILMILGFLPGLVLASSQKGLNRDRVARARQIFRATEGAAHIVVASAFVQSFRICVPAAFPEYAKNKNFDAIMQWLLALAVLLISMTALVTTRDFTRMPPCLSGLEACCCLTDRHGRRQRFFGWLPEGLPTTHKKKHKQRFKQAGLCCTLANSYRSSLLRVAAQACVVAGALALQGATMQTFPQDCPTHLLYYARTSHTPSLLRQ